MELINIKKRALALKENLKKRNQLKASKQQGLINSNKVLSLIESNYSPNYNKEKIVIVGGNKLVGSVDIMGAKNAALPIICACILANKPVTLHNIPPLSDVKTISAILNELNCKITDLGGNSLSITPNTAENTVASQQLCSIMRASILVLGPLLAKYGKATVPMPGGCSIGKRPVDLHVAALEKMGATIKIENETVYAVAKNGLIGTEIHFPIVSVGATENIIMAAAYATGTSTLTNCAIEPEIKDLCNFLVQIGANISGIGTSTLVINGSKELVGTKSYTIIPDRIEAASYIALALSTKGKIELNNVNKEIFGNLLDYFRKVGGSIEFKNETTLIAEYTKPLSPINITTNPFPHFPTDAQSPFMVLLALIEGESSINETIFEDRYNHVAELKKIGANISINGSIAKIIGVNSFSGSAQLVATDLRASFALIIAALCNKNSCSIIKLDYLDRGYLNVVNNLKSLGANINRGVNL